MAYLKRKSMLKLNQQLQKLCNMAQVFNLQTFQMAAFMTFENRVIHSYSLTTKSGNWLVATKIPLILGFYIACTTIALAQTNSNSTKNSNAAANTSASASSQATSGALSSILVTNPFGNSGTFRFRFGSNNQSGDSVGIKTADRMPDARNLEGLEGGIAGAGDFSNWSVWATPVVSQFKNNIQPYTSNGTVVIGMAGLEYSHDDVLISGVSVAVNDTNSTTTYNNGTYKTVGVTVSPYAVYQINDLVMLDTSVGVGGSNPTTSAGGATGTTTYNSMFAVMGLTNRTDFGNVLLTPRVSYSYYVDKLGAYTNSLGAYNASYNTYLGQTQLGAQLAYDTKLGAQPFISAYQFFNTWNSNQMGTTAPSVYPSTYRFTAGVNASKGIFYGTVSYQIEKSVSQFRIYGGFRF